MYPENLTRLNYEEQFKSSKKGVSGKTFILTFDAKFSLGQPKYDKAEKCPSCESYRSLIKRNFHTIVINSIVIKFPWAK